MRFEGIETIRLETSDGQTSDDIEAEGFSVISDRHR